MKVKRKLGKLWVSPVLYLCIDINLYLYLHIDKEDILLRKSDFSYDHVTKKRRERTELRDMLNLTNSRLKNYDTRRGEGMKVREAITKAFWDEKK